jgi:TetR/AcrR family transcriptional regulator, transcriptional repressor for nem operon
MVRPKNFDSDVVLLQVADAFTQHGYEGTSMAVLCEATGLGKQSLYNAFGDKEALYCLAIDASATRFAGRLDDIPNARNGLGAIEMFFSVLLGLCASKSAAENNCIVSAGLLEGIEKPQVSDKLHEKWRASRKFFVQAISAGQSDGSTRQDLPAEQFADLMMALMSGLRVSARAELDKKQLKSIVDLGLSVLTK